MQVAEYVSIYADLQQREPELFSLLLKIMYDCPNIKEEAGQLNLRYERNEPSAVKV